MTTLAHMCGGDLVLDATGGLAVAHDARETRQMIVRRLCTNPGDYIWQISYGAGLPAMIGAPVDSSRIGSIVQSQMSLEAGVDLFSLSDVSLNSDNTGGVFCTISYMDTASGQTQSIAVSSS